jgi:hypothetical protein
MLAEFFSHRSKWVKGFAERNGGACLEVAAIRVCSLEVQGDASGIADSCIRLMTILRPALKKAIQEIFPERWNETYPIIEFNDHEDTTFEDILMVSYLADSYYREKITEFPEEQEMLLSSRLPPRQPLQSRILSTP